jgi:hypothetical protein
VPGVAPLAVPGGDAVRAQLARKPEERRRRRRPRRPAVGARLLRRATFLLPLVLVVGGGLWWGAARHTSGPQPAPVFTSADAPRLGRLVGRWLRPDGGYVIEIRSVAESGGIDASYLNLNPIHIARAEASKAGEALRVDIELRGVNYPGSSYTLTYDPARDELQGLYYQAALERLFPVVFVRMPGSPQ